jgi:hypothetical protein
MILFDGKKEFKDMGKQFDFYSIEIEGDSTYVANIESVLRTILGYGFGKILFNCLPKAKTILIRPFIPSLLNKCNARSREPEGFFTPKFPIEFTPNMWIVGSKCYDSGPGGTPDEILLHEMLHAYRRVKGTFFLQNFTKKDKSFDTSEEIFAIILTNIYLSEKGKISLRKDHADFSELPAKWSTSEGMMNDPDFNEWVGKFWSSDNELASQIARSNAVFNPFKNYRQMMTAKKML